MYTIKLIFKNGKIISLKADDYKHDVRLNTLQLFKDGLLWGHIFINDIAGFLIGF